MMHLFHTDQIDRYFGRGLEPATTSRLLRRLWRCAGCRARYERHLLFERLLPDGADHRDDRLWRTILASAGREHQSGSSAPHRAIATRPLRPWWAPVAALGALSLVVVATQVARIQAPTTPVSRGGTNESVLEPALHLFRTMGEHETAPVGRTMRADDGILIAYSNPGSELKYLMVFAVDQRGNVHWYYPAYERPGENPAAAPIRTQALGVELGEEIRHPLTPGPLRMFALFLPRPWHVDQIERMVTEAWGVQGKSLAQLTTLPVPEGKQVSRLLEVTP
jgi:hypothetical protein